MQLLAYDNGGSTADRYTIILKNDEGEQDCYAMSEDVRSPNGVCIYLGDRANTDWMKLIDNDKLPSTVLLAILELARSDLEALAKENILLHSQD